jgi:hypothetical protein
MSNTAFAHALRVAVGTVIALAALSVAASAQSKKLGPGPFTSARVTDKGLLLTVGTGDSSAVPLSGSVTVSATRGAAEWTRFDRRASVKRGGSQLVQSGTIDGASIDEYFPDGAQRRLLVRNGDGATTELDVQRVSTGFFILLSNRSPGAATKSAYRTATERIDALDDGPVTLELSKQTSPPGIDVVVAVTAPAPSEGVDRQYPNVFATDANGFMYYGRGYGFAAATGGVSFTHLSLPEGSYTLGAQTLVSIGNPVVSAEVSVTVPSALATPIAVSKENRLFAVTLPQPELPEMVDATITVDGLDQFEPSFANRLDLSLFLHSADSRLQVRAQRDVGDPSPVSVPVRVPAGEYSLTVSASHDDEQENGRGYSMQLSFGDRAFPGDVTVSVPPLARLSGTVRDPDFALASESNLPSLPPTHYVSASPAQGGGDFSAEAVLHGFARGYRLFVPRGASVSVGASLDVALGPLPDEYRSWENSTGSLDLAPSPDPIRCDGDCEADVTVPSVPRYVTLAGTLVDERGRKVTRAVVNASLEGVGGEGTSFRAVVLTNANGEFRLRLPRGRGYYLSAFAF